jgi:hypothetical protein
MKPSDIQRFERKGYKSNPLSEEILANLLMPAFHSDNLLENVEQMHPVGFAADLGWVRV